MRIFALLSLVSGFLAQLILDGQVFDHALFGLVCGLITFLCSLFLLRKQSKRGFKVLAGFGLLLLVLCLLSLPTTYRSQKKFNDKIEEIRKMRN
jgi:energy-coupling factor transporter transmembrane protein EcfT